MNQELDSSANSLKQNVNSKYSFIAGNRGSDTKLNRENLRI